MVLSFGHCTVSKLKYNTEYTKLEAPSTCVVTTLKGTVPRTQYLITNFLTLTLMFLKDYGVLRSHLDVSQRINMSKIVALLRLKAVKA